ncbi:nucleotidyltransferase domain-containing protein [Candidatus Sumerlaeota bacterium]|nr:nucleotidyltransferase domain-containing protein [Candidatus Sumerlaeota bacterium]
MKKYGAREIYIFGSSGTGTISDSSDIDLAISGLPPENYFHAFSEAQCLLERPLDLIDLDTPTLFTEYLKKKGKLRRVA